MCQMSNSALQKCPRIHWQDDFLLESSRSRLRTAQALWKVVNGDGKWPEVWEYHPTGQPKLSKQSSSIHEWKQVVSTPSTEVISSHNRRSPIISDWSAELLPGCINLMWPFILLHGYFFQGASLYCWGRSWRQHCSEQRGEGLAQTVCLEFR